MCCNGILVLFALIIGIGALVYVVYQFYSFIKCGCGKYGPFVSSYGKIKEDILDEARKVLKKSKKPLKVTDLGCGSGALLIPLAKEFPQHEFVGLEWDVVPLTMGKIKARGLKNIRFVKGDYMKTNHSDMDLIMCYVLKVTGEPLGKKLAKEILPNMAFDMKALKVHGNAGCNIFNSTLVLDGGDISAITIAPGAATMMSCPDMEIEDAVLQAMGEVKQVKAGQSESEMILADAEGNALLILWVCLLLFVKWKS